jgi:transposase
MQGQKRFSPKLFYSLNLEDLVPKEHLLRRFDILISLDFLYEETRIYYSHTGQPSVDPVVLFKMMLLGYLFGISSDRKLAVEVQVNMAFRWYLGYDLDEPTLNHSVLSNARGRFPEEVFVAFFNRVIGLCLQAGLIKGQALCLDSTLIRADASLDSFVEVKEEPQAYIKRVYRENNFEDDEHLAKDGTIGRHFDGDVDVQKMGKRRKRCFVNSEYKSTTDPEASMVYRPGIGRLPAYKGHLAVDTHRRIITAVEVSSGTADDTTAVDSLLTGHALATGRLLEFAVADSHYGTSELYNYLDQKGIEAVIKPRRTKNRPGFFTIDDFEYDSENDRYICPQGRTLRLKTYQHTLHRKNYVADKKACRECPLRDRCTTSKRQGRLLTRFIDDHFEVADRMVGSPFGQDLLRQRQTAIEGVFGEAKAFHLLRRALFRGKAKLKIQLLLTAAVLNLKRLARWMENRAENLMAIFQNLHFLLSKILIFEKPLSESFTIV